MLPSLSTLESLAQGAGQQQQQQQTQLSSPQLLHGLLWGPRSLQMLFNGWIKDGLVRQSLTTRKADALLKAVTKTCNHLKHDLAVLS